MSISVNSETDEGTARLAQSAERKALNLVVVGSSPTVGVVCTVLHVSEGPSALALPSSCAPPMKCRALAPLLRLGEA